MQPPWNYGEVTLPRNLVLALALRGLNIKVFSIYRCSNNEQYNNDYRFPDNVSLSYFKNDIELLKCALRNSKNNSIHVMSFSFTKASLLRLATQSTMFFYVYSPIPNILGGLVKAKAYLKAIIGYNTSRLVGRLITTSPYIYDNVIKKVTIPANDVYLIPAPIYFPGNYLRSDEKDTNYDLRILYMGHISPYRFPYKQIMKAITELKKSRLSVFLKVIVPALQSNYKNFSMLRSTLEHNKDICIEFRNLNEHEKLLEFASSDVYLYPSLGVAAVDPPLSVLEAMFCGCLVIATNVQSIPWILNKGRGIIINKLNFSEELTKALSIALDKKGRKKIVDNAKAYVTSVHSIESVSKKLGNIISGSL